MTILASQMEASFGEQGHDLISRCKLAAKKSSSEWLKRSAFSLNQLVSVI